MTPDVRSSVLFGMLLFLQSVLMSAPNFCPPRQDEKRMCYREKCLQMADDMLEKMDISMHPCQNFYQYACRGWLNRQFLNPKRKRATTFTNNLPWGLIRKFLAEAPKRTDLLAVQKAKAFYASCLKYGDDFDLRNGQLSPLPFSVYDEGMYSLESALITAIQLGVHPLFELRADPSSFTDPEKRQRRSNLYVSKPVLGMDYDHYEVLSRSQVFRDKYETEKLFDLWDVGYYLIYGFDIDDKQIVQQLVDVELTLAMMYNNLTNKGVTVNMTLEQLDAAYGPFLNWTRFVSILASSPEVGITDITPQEVVFVRDPEYLRKIFEYFAVLPTRTQIGYLFMRVYDSLKFSLTEDHKKAEFYLADPRNSNSHGRSTYLQHRELGCVKQTSQIFDLVVHRFLYLSYRLREFQIFNRKISLSFAALVNSLDWMSTNTKDKIVNKGISTRTVLSFHENAMNDSLLESYYSNITGDDYMQSLVLARKAAFVRDFKNIRRTREADPPSFPHQFVAEYSRQLNKLYINPIVIHEPFYHDDYESLNFAGVGSVLIQELMRGFDTRGIRYNTNGAQGTWLSDSEIQTYNERAQCLVEQYNNYTYGPAGMQVNGTLTLDSNIGDAIGLKLAYHAYSQNNPVLDDSPLLPGVPLTNKQLFFVRFAQMRCTKENTEAAITMMSGEKSPDEFRVNGPLRNLREFSTAFGCPADSYMNPPNKCVVW